MKKKSCYLAWPLKSSQPFVFVLGVVVNNYEFLKQMKQTTRTGTEPQKWRSHEGLSIGEWRGEREERYRE